jgi:hypothetical protein
VAVLTEDAAPGGSFAFMSPERFLAQLLVHLGIVEGQPPDVGSWRTEQFDRDAVRRLTDALLLVQEQLQDHWRQDGDTSLAQALPRAAADQSARQEGEFHARWLAHRDREAAGSDHDGPGPA